jgi:hypothetical protein
MITIGQRLGGLGVLEMLQRWDIGGEVVAAGRLLMGDTLGECKILQYEFPLSSAPARDK